MSTEEEFAFIVAQLEWLEMHLREQPLAVSTGRSEAVLDALSCARVLIVELSFIGRARAERDALAAA